MADDRWPQHNPEGLHTFCGPTNLAGQALHRHLWPMNADHTKRYRPVPYVGKHRYREEARRGDGFCTCHVPRVEPAVDCGIAEHRAAALEARRGE